MPADQVISFGPYRLDRASGRLLRGGTNVPLRRKTFAVLEYLATRPGRLIAKHELLDAVWPATHVTPSVLAGCIRELRQALGDDARAARFCDAEKRSLRSAVASAPSGTRHAEFARSEPRLRSPPRRPRPRACSPPSRPKAPTTSPASPSARTSPKTASAFPSCSICGCWTRPRASGSRAPP